MSTIVDLLFLASVVLPAAVVVLGVALLAWPNRHREAAVASAPRSQAHAH